MILLYNYLRNILVASWAASLAFTSGEATRGQTIEPRLEEARLTPLAPRNPPVAHPTNQDSSSTSPIYDPQVAGASFDRQLDLTPSWSDTALGANQQSTWARDTASFADALPACADGSCRMSPSVDAATAQRDFGGPESSNDALPVPAVQPPSWVERIALHAMEINWKKMLGSLALVIGGYLGLVWIAKRFSPGSHRTLPQDVLEVVGSVRLDARHQLQLIRLGSKLLLIHRSPEGMTNIGEITNPNEVEDLLAACSAPRRTRPAGPRPRQLPERQIDPNLALEQLVQSLQQAIRRTGPHAEFEA